MIRALIFAVEALQTLAFPFPLQPGTRFVYRELYAEPRDGIDAISEDETQFLVKRRAAQWLIVHTGGADPAGTVPVEFGPGFVRLGPWTGEEPLPLPLALGARGPAEEDRAGWVVEALEQVGVPAGTFTAFRCALRTWRSESLLWIAPDVGVVKETLGAPGARPEIERVLLRVITATSEGRVGR